MDNMDMEVASSSVDSYSDIVTEQLEFTIRDARDGSPRAVDLSNSIEPRDDQGGLDRNQLVELLGYEGYMTINMEHAGQTQPDDYPLHPGSVDVQVAYGANLSPDEVPNHFDDDIAESPGDGQYDVGGGDTSGLAVPIFQKSEAGIFELFGGVYQLPFYDTLGDGTSGSAGPYGAGQTMDLTGATLDRMYQRDLGVRGPVLDENDEIGVVARLIKENAGSESGQELEVEATVRVQNFYRLHEVEQVRNDFDLP
jgi:hypothetical protein